MDQQIEEYIQNIVSGCLNSPAFANLTPEQRPEAESRLQAYFYRVIVETLINRLSEEQLNQIQDLDFSSPEMEAKLEQFAAAIPGFYQDMDEKLQQEAELVKQTGIIPT